MEKSTLENRLERRLEKSRHEKDMEDFRHFERKHERLQRVVGWVPEWESELASIRNGNDESGVA
jgi:hypothetical protein